MDQNHRRASALLITIVKSLEESKPIILQKVSDLLRVIYFDCSIVVLPSVA